MRARYTVSGSSLYATFRAARLVLAAGTLSGLAVLGACSDSPVASKLQGPELSTPRLDLGVGANSHTIQVCVDPFATPGTYDFTVAFLPFGFPPFPWFELQSSVDPDLSGFGITQNSTGPFLGGGDNDVITANVSVDEGQCADVFVRANTCPGGVCGVDPFDNGGNRLWTDANGTTNPYGSVSITATIPAGATYSVVCVNDDPNLPQTPACGPVGPWSATTQYKIGDAVDYSGSIWRALTATVNFPVGGPYAAPVAGADWEIVPIPLVATTVFSSANVFHGSVATFDFQVDVVDPAVFLILDEDAIDNGLPPNFFNAKPVNDDIAKLGQRRELRFFAENEGLQIVLHSGGMGDEGWFAPNFIPSSWADTGPTSDGLTNFIGPIVGKGLGKGKDPEKYLDKIPDVRPLRAEGLYMLTGRTVCAVVYDSDISINYNPIDGSLKGATLGIAAFTVDLVEYLGGYSSGTLPKVTITIRDADLVCAGLQELLDAPIPLTSSTEIDLYPNASG